MNNEAKRERLKNAKIGKCGKCMYSCLVRHLLECRRNPPIVVYTGSGDVDPFFPSVPEDEESNCWCGEFEPKECEADNETH